MLDLSSPHGTLTCLLTRSVCTQFIYASISCLIFSDDSLNRDLLTLLWPRHRVTGQETSVLLLALTH